MARRGGGLTGKRSGRKGIKNHLHGPDRDKLIAAKKRLARALADKGIGWVIDIINAGPYVEADLEGNVDQRSQAEKQSLFQWAITFAADRAGMPKLIAVADAGAAEAMPPITVTIVGHQRPSDT